MDTFFIIATWGGSVLILGPASLVIAAILSLYRRIRDALLVLGGLYGAMVITHILKVMIARPRPPAEDMLVSVPSGFSFPSAHTSQAVALAMSVILIFQAEIAKKWRGVFIAIMVILAILVGASRVYLGVHYLSDVVAGALLGLLWIIALHNLINNTGKER